MKKTVNSSIGMTLIEILIALAILAFVTTSVYQIIESSITTKERTISEDRAFLQLETALNRIDLDFIQMYSPLFYAAINNKNDQDHEQISYDEDSERFKEKTVDGGNIPIIDTPDKQTLIFLTHANRRKRVNDKQSNFAWIKYTLKRSEKDKKQDEDVLTGEYDLIRYFDPGEVYNNQFQWDDITPQILIKNVNSIKFSFWDSYEYKYVSSINELKNKKDIIRSIKIEITYINETHTEDTTERVFRIAWPFFDTKADEEEKAKAKKSKPTTSTNRDRDE